MVMYPAVYVVLTLPIAVGRMVAMTGTYMRSRYTDGTRNSELTISGTQLPDAFFCVAGTLLTSCGWIDALLYTLTRRIFITNEHSSNHTHRRTANLTVATQNGTRPGDTASAIGMSSMDKEMGPTDRSVTIVGGCNRMSRIAESRRSRDRDRGRSHIRDRHGHPDPLREHSPTGSQDSIIKPPDPGAIGIVTETEISIDVARDDDSRFESRDGSQTEREGKIYV
jgi:hypothetical protein